MGCLKAMFARIGCLVVVVALGAVVFLYRYQIREYYRQFRHLPTEEFVAADPARAASARATLQALARRGGPAYVDLTAADVAALVDESLARSGRRVLDSVQTALLDGEIRVRGSLDLSGVPRSLLGPLAGAVGEHEPAAIGGPLSVDSSGHLVLTVTYLRLREFPFPRATIPRILGAAHLPDVDGARVPLPGISDAGDVRVSRRSVRLYRRSP